MRPSGWSRAATPRSCRPTRRAPQLAAAKAQLETARGRACRRSRSTRRSTASSTACRSRTEARSWQAARWRRCINLDPLLAIGEVSERDLQYLKLGSEADIRLVNGTTVKGTLRYISRDASTATRTFRVEVAIPNEDKTLPAGMTAEITLRSPPGRRGDPAALGGDAERCRRPRHPRGRQGQQGRRSIPIDLIDDTTNGPGARRHSRRCAHHRCRPGAGDGRRRGEAGRSRCRDGQEAGSGAAAGTQ